MSRLPSPAIAPAPAPGGSAAPEQAAGDPASMPAGTAAHPSQVVEHFFRHESGRLHGVLTRLLGIHHLSLVEDVAQEALLRAMRAWSIGGIPANPSAWITRVALNLGRDALRHRRMSAAKEPAVITHLDQTRPETESVEARATAVVDAEIRDDALRLMFVCCHPSLSADSQVALALKVLCGFSTTEIARAFLSTEAAVEKQLTRTKQRLRDAGVAFELPPGAELASRLDGVLAALYLLFNEGYKASAGDRLLREDLCAEAIRLATVLVSHPAGDRPHCHALLALMLLTSARFPSRVDEEGDLLRLDDQNRTQWDQSLIQRGLEQLARSASGAELSEYHLQAGIAACHCTAADAASTDWPRILGYYDHLVALKPSPIVALNRAVAVARVSGPQAALDAIEAMPRADRLESHYLLHAVIGELHLRLNQPLRAAESLRRALQLARVGPEQTHLARMLERTTHGHHRAPARRTPPTADLTAPGATPPALS